MLFAWAPQKKKNKPESTWANGGLICGIPAAGQIEATPLIKETKD